MLYINLISLNIDHSSLSLVRHLFEQVLLSIFLFIISRSLDVFLCCVGMRMAHKVLSLHKVSCFLIEVSCLSDSEVMTLNFQFMFVEEL